MFEDGFAAAPSPARVARLDDKVALDEVKQVEMKRLHFAEFEEIEAGFRPLFHVEINGDVAHVSFYDDRHL